MWLFRPPHHRGRCHQAAAEAGGERIAWPMPEGVQPSMQRERMCARCIGKKRADDGAAPGDERTLTQASTTKARRSVAWAMTIPGTLPAMNAGIAENSTAAWPKSPVPPAIAARVVLPVMKDTKFPVSIRPTASVMPAKKEMEATSASPVSLRRVLMRRRRRCLVMTESG